MNLCQVMAGATVALCLTCDAQAELGDTLANVDRRRAKMLERFDADGDGRLSQQERAAAQEARAARQGKRNRGERDPGNADGRNGKRGKESGSGGRRLKMLQQFDANDDGRLDPEEKRAARASTAKGRRRRGPSARRRTRGGADQQSGKRCRKGQDGASVRRQRMLRRFDANNGGQLDPENRQVARDRRGKVAGRRGGERRARRRPRQ